MDHFHRLLTVPNPEPQVARDLQNQPNDTLTKDLTIRPQYHQKIMETFGNSGVKNTSKIYENTILP